MTAVQSHPRQHDIETMESGYTSQSRDWGDPITAGEKPDWLNG